MKVSGEWYKRQQTETEIEENSSCLEKVKSRSIESPNAYFEYVVDRLFMALGEFKEFEIFMKLDSNFKPVSVAGAGVEDCLVTYDDFKLVVEATRRPLYNTALHWNHLEKNQNGMLAGIIVILDITAVDDNLWQKNKKRFDEKKEFFHLCDADFIFKLLKDQPNAFSKFKEFLFASEKIWTDEKGYETIKKKIITLVRPENES